MFTYSLGQVRRGVKHLASLDWWLCGVNQTQILNMLKVTAFDQTLYDVFYFLFYSPQFVLFCLQFSMFDV